MGHLTAAEAAAELGISVQTLYAYVSRGRLRSVADGRSRARRYLQEDVLALKQKKLYRGDPARVAEEALHRGLPVLASRVSVVADGRLYYRGLDAVELAASSTFEQVIALLWLGDLAAPLPAAPANFGFPWRDADRATQGLPPLAACQLILPLASAHDPGGYDLRPHAVQRAGVRILSLLIAVATRRRPTSAGIARHLQRVWRPKDDVAALLEAALILYADNGLSPSTFAARCVASAGSSPYEVVAAGLAALQGSKHGGASERAEALFQEAGASGGARRAVAARLRRGEEMPGFGHPSYPGGDPRGELLLELAARQRPRSPAVAAAKRIVDAVREMVNQAPNVDFGVVTLCRALELPPAAPLTLLGLARTAGWIAHALEQYEEGRVIRPQARYSGEPPGERSTRSGADHG
jgi:citrate synthase